MSSDPKLTILTPVLNAVRFMPGCLQNVLDQSYSKVEHLIVDGGSTDGTLEVVKEAASKYPERVRLLEAPGTSQSEAMNQGIAAAKGEVLGILNADDFYEPDALDSALKLISSIPKPAFVCANCKVLNDSGAVTSINKPSRMSLSDLLAGRPYPWNPTAYFYHKSLHDLVGLYDESDSYTMDLDFILRAVPEASVHYVDETWGNFRLIPGAKTFDQGNDVHTKVEAVRRRYFESASFLTRWNACLKKRYDCLSHKIKRRINFVSQ